MKKIVTVLMFLFVSLASRPQISLEQVYPASTGLTNLALSGYKYFLMDVTNNQCRIYNPDHSLWKTVNLSVPAGMYLYDIKFVSETLFNSDNKVELAYIYYSYDTTLLYYTYYTRIVNESGNELLSIPGCAYLEVKSAGSAGTKMLAYIYDYSIVLWTLNTAVYYLPGSLPVGEYDLQAPAPAGLPYPNPAGSVVNIPYRLPGATSTGMVALFDMKGTQLRQYPVDNTFHELTIRMEDLPPGAYSYRLSCGNTILASGKILHD